MPPGVGQGFGYPSQPRTTCPHTSPQALSLSLGCCSSLSHFRTPSGMSRAGMFPPDRWALSSPLTAGLFRDVCLSSRTLHTQERGMVGPGGALHQPGPQCKTVASMGAVSLPSVPSWWRAPMPGPCSGCPTCQRAWGRWKQVRWGLVCGQRLLHAHTPPRRCTASRRVRGHPLFLPLL